MLTEETFLNWMRMLQVEIGPWDLIWLAMQILLVSAVAQVSAKIVVIQTLLETSLAQA
jgi:hypothetical protein